jgi:membrane associated rhomboid family serine protease
MIPIGDDRVTGGRAPIVNWVLIAINTLVFIYEFTLSQPALERLIMNYGVVPTAITHGQGLLTLLTSMFLHGGWLHLIGNMVFLWVFGDNIEDVLGHLGYLAFYLLGGLAAAAGQILSNPGSMVPSVGASGAIAAVMGAYIVMFPRSHIRGLLFLGLYATIVRVTAIVFLGFWIFTQFLSGIASLGAPTAQTEGVAWFAHIAGFVFGLLAGFLMRGRVRRLGYDQPYEAYRQ